MTSPTYRPHDPDRDGDCTCGFEPMGEYSTCPVHAPQHATDTRPAKGVVVQQLVIRFEEPRDSAGSLMAREDWIQGVSEAAIGGVRAWAAGARAIFEPTLEIEEVESRVR